MQHGVMVRFLIVCVVVSAVPAWAEPAEDAARVFADGKALVSAVKFDEALQAFATAVKADANNQEYRQTHAMLRQVIRMREEIEKTQAPDEWMSMARALRTFYHDHGVYSESLPLDRKIHQQHLATDSAAMLAETLLALDENSEAAEMLGNLDKKETTPRTDVLLGLSLARQGRIEEAKAVASKASVKDDAGPRVFYELGCLRALTGDPKASLEALTRSFELTPPGRLDACKAEAKECKDLAALASTADFAKAIETQSKVKESSCSSGAGCGKCPKRAKCGSKTTKD